MWKAKLIDRIGFVELCNIPQNCSTSSASKIPARSPAWPFNYSASQMLLFILSRADAKSKSFNMVEPRTDGGNRRTGTTSTPSLCRRPEHNGINLELSSILLWMMVQRRLGHIKNLIFWLLNYFLIPHVVFRLVWSESGKAFSRRLWQGKLIWKVWSTIMHCGARW